MNSTAIYSSWSVAGIIPDASSQTRRNIEITAGRSISNAFSETSANSFLEEKNEDWEAELYLFQGINIALIVLVTWLLLSLIVYGLKTGRFTKKAQSSSLNNGVIYTACLITVICLLPSLIITQIFNVLQRKGEIDCEMFGDLATVGYGFSLYAVYMFLWFRQRVIYMHPFVKSKVSKAMNWISRGYVIFLTSVTVGLLCVFLIPDTYHITPYGCYENFPTETSYIIATTFLIAQAITLWLCIYPSTRVSIRLNQASKPPKPEDEDQSYDEGEDENQREKSSSSCGACCVFLSKTVKSPVEMTIKRTAFCSIIIVLTDIVAVAIETIVLPKEAPAVLRQTIVDISSCINLFCVIGTFGFAINIFTLFCPSCPKKTWRKTAVETQSEIETNLDTQPSSKNSSGDVV